MRRPISLSGITLGSLLLSLLGCQEAPKPGPKAPKKTAKKAAPDAAAPDAGPPPSCTITFAASAPFGAPDPLLAQDPEAKLLAVNAFEGLMRMPQHEGEVIPGAASGYTISPDGMTYTFTLRDGLKWSDGQPLTAKDFAFAWRRALQLKPEGVELTPLTRIEGAEAVMAGEPDAKLSIQTPDPKTLVVRLRHVDFGLPEWAALPPTLPVPSHLFEPGQLTPKSWAFNGPFVLEAGRLVRNPHHRFWASVRPNSPREIPVSAVEAKVLDGEAALKAVRAGEISWTGFVPLELDWIPQPAEEVGYRADPTATLYVLAFNTKRGPAKSKDLRAILSLAVNRPDLMAKIKGGLQMAHHLYPTLPGIAVASLLDESFVRAQDLMKQLKKKPKAPLQLIYQETAQLKAIAEVLKTNLERLGLTLELAPLTPETSIEKADIALVESGVSARTFYDGLSPYFSAGGPNVFGVEHKEGASYLKDGLYTREKDGAYMELFQAEERLIRDHLFTPLLLKSRVHVFRGRGLGINPVGAYALEHLACPRPPADAQRPRPGKG